jgi:phage-related protein
MREKKHREIVFYKDFFLEFFRKQNQKVKDKILWTFRLIETQELIPSDYFKHLEGTDGLFEIRIKLGSDIYRIFCFFDEGKLVVLANGFQKKTQKSPRTELKKALKIKDEYEQQK